MNLDFSVDKLYETGWQPEQAAEGSGTSASATGAGLERLPDGRWYPSVLKVQQLFAAAGYELAIRHVTLFECYRASWADGSGCAAGAVVGSDEREAAVYALAQMRKNLTPHPTNS